MICRDVRERSDLFLSNELPTETAHGMLQHLDTCAACREGVEVRVRLRDAVRDAFHRAPMLEPQPDFADRLREHLSEMAAPDGRPNYYSRRWFTKAAGVALAAGLTGIIFLDGSVSSADALARDAIGDHRNCALKYKLVRTPMPLDEAAKRFDQAFGVLRDAPPDTIAMPAGPAHVIDRHSCAYNARRFGHVVLQYRGTVVSLLITATGGTRADAADAIPHVIGRPTKGLPVVTVNGPHHAVMLVGDLDTGELTQLSHSVAMPLSLEIAAAAVQPGDEVPVRER